MRKNLAIRTDFRFFAIDPVRGAGISFSALHVLTAAPIRMLNSRARSIESS